MKENTLLLKTDYFDQLIIIKMEVTEALSSDQIEVIKVTIRLIATYRGVDYRTNYAAWLTYIQKTTQR